LNATAAFPAAVGWDAVTGLGTPNYAVLEKLALTSLKSDDDPDSISGPRNVHVPEFLTMFNVPGCRKCAARQHTFANLLQQGNLTDLVDASAQYGTTGFLSIQHIGVWGTIVEHNKYNNQTGLRHGWQAILDAVLKLAEPHLKTKVLSGIFLGDERSCGGIPFKSVTAVADVVRAFLDSVAPSARVYINECVTPFAHCYKANGTIAGLDCVDCNKATPGAKCWGAHIPASIDLISLDM
jgi:hypothetical protein